MKQIQRYDRGAVSGWMIATISLIVLVLGLGSLAIWSWVSYVDASTNIDSKIATAEAQAKKDQADEDEEKFAEREKEPRRDFTAPDDFGRLSFTYPKTWSVYVEKDPVAEERTGGEYIAYLHPIVVPPTSIRDQQFATRVSIVNENYNEYLKDFDRLIEDGDLRSSAVSINGENGVRLDGNFSDAIRGSAVIFKIRDKTAVVRTDADTFKHDFNELIKTITFVK